MLQKKWKNLPAALRTVLTLLAVLALAALLTTVRHNASAYRTGVWDTGSQTLIYGRMHQMEQGQHAPGGFLGVYTEDWSDGQNRSWFREDTPADAAQFRPYTHQSGLQGWALGGLNRLLRVFLPEGTARETALYWVNSTPVLRCAAADGTGRLAGAWRAAGRVLDGSHTAGPMAAVRHEGPVLGAMDLAAAAAGRAAALPLHLRPGPHPALVLAAGQPCRAGALHVRV